jgi:hypothetical protein
VDVDLTEDAADDLRRIPRFVRRPLAAEFPYLLDPHYAERVRADTLRGRRVWTVKVGNFTVGFRVIGGRRILIEFVLSPGTMSALRKRLLDDD